MVYVSDKKHTGNKPTEVNQKHITEKVKNQIRYQEKQGLKPKEINKHLINLGLRPPKYSQMLYFIKTLRNERTEPTKNSSLNELKTWCWKDCKYRMMKMKSS